MAMPPLNRLWRSVLSFAVLYGLLLAPWPGFHYAIGSYVRAVGSRVFGQSGRAFMDGLARNRTGSVTTTADHMVLFRPIGAADKSYSAATDTIVVLYNFNAVDKDNKSGWKIGLENKNYFWLPFAFYLALVGATPIPWRRRAWALFWGFLTANVLLLLTLAVYLADHASDLSMIVLSPFGKSAVNGLTRLLLVVSGPSTFIYFLIWPFACFRLNDLAQLVPGWGDSTPTPADTTAPVRQNWRVRLKAARSRGR